MEILRWGSSTNDARPFRTVPRRRLFRHVFRETLLERLARIAWLAVLVVVTFPTLSGQVSVMTTCLPAFKIQRNIHTDDVAASNTVKTRLDVREVLVGKPAVKEGPGL